MAFDNDFLEFMPQTVTYKPRTGQNGYDEPTYGAAVTFRARVTPRKKILWAGTSEAKVSTLQVYCPPFTTTGVTTKIEPDGQLTLPDGSVRPMLDVYHAEDESGFNHQQVSV